MNEWVLTSIITFQIFLTAQGAPKLLNEACASGDTCLDSSGKNLVLLCDVLVKRCLIKAGQSCEDFGDLCINGAFCKTEASSKKCTCSTGYTGDDCVAATQKPGAQCTPGTDVCITNADCTDGRCACDVGHALVDGGTCAAVAANTIGATCAATPPNTKGDCKDDNALCPAASGGRCVCKDGYVGVTGGGCNIMPNRVGGRCTTTTTGSQGTCGDKAVCSAAANGVCQCPRGHEGNNGDTGCNVMPNKLGGSCTTNTAASRGSCDGDGLCSATPNGVCQCPQGYQGQHGDTVCNADVGTACNANVGCVTSSVCDNVFGKCLIQAGRSCASPNGDKCVSHATCKVGTCACGNDYTADATGLCNANVGTPCNASVSCVASFVCDNVFGKCLIPEGASCTLNTDKCVSNATCTEGDSLCACRDGYAGKDGLCVLQNNGGAAGVSMWLLVYMLVTGLCLTVFVV